MEVTAWWQELMIPYCVHTCLNIYLGVWPHQLVAAALRIFVASCGIVVVTDSLVGMQELTCSMAPGFLVH